MKFKAVCLVHSGFVVNKSEKNDQIFLKKWIQKSTDILLFGYPSYWSGVMNKYLNYEWMYFL